MNNSKIFWSNYNEISYDRFLSDLVSSGDNNIFIKNSNPYKVFLNLIRNVINNKDSTILDADFSITELENLNLSKRIITDGKYFQPDLSSKFKTFEDILYFLNLNKSKINFTLYTSGTTGRPKSIIQSLANTIKGVRVANKFKDDIWGFAYNPTHFAGLQVFFQALFNKNTIVYIFGKDFSEIVDLMCKKSINSLSSTPSFIKMLLPNFTNPLLSLKRLSFGGERFDDSVLDNIKIVFPNAVVKNVYASTESGSILISNGKYFQIPDKFAELVKIENDELLIHSSLMGKSESLELKGGWYFSGDLVTMIDSKSFVFQSRKSEMINVGGYKVNPSEIESLINDIEGVSDVRVYGRKNSILGNIIAADIIKNNNISEAQLKRQITNKCKNLLQEFKIPRIIKIVDSFEMTRTGKIKR